MTDLISAYISPDSNSVLLSIEQIVSDENIDEEYARTLSKGDVVNFTPIIVIKHPHKPLYAVLDGHHRFKAAKLVGVKEIRAVIVDDYTGLGFNLTSRGVFQPSVEVTRYIRVPLKRFREQMLKFLFDE